MDHASTVQQDQWEKLQAENLRLKSELKRQQELYEKSHMELIELMVESEQQAQKLKTMHQRISQAFKHTIQIIQLMIDMRQPGYRMHAERVAEHAQAIALKAGVNKIEAQVIAVAARIHEVGKMSIPEVILSKPTEGLTESEINLLRSQHAIGAALLTKIPSFRSVAQVIRHIRENVDGSGRPDGLSGNEIPIGSRIIALVDCFDTRFMLEQTTHNAEEVLQEIEKQLDLVFDRHLFPFLVDRVRGHYQNSYRPREKSIALAQLREGMRLSRDLYTISGVMLLPRGTELTETLIEKIMRYQSIDPVAGGVYIELR